MKYIGHFYEEDLPPLHSPDQGRHINWTRKSLIDHSLGAEHLVVMLVDLGPGGVVALHDNPFEHTYYILEGEAVMTLDGKEYRVGPGGYAWTATGATHAIRNEGRTKVRWLEFIAPPGPDQGGFRWLEDWVRREKEESTLKGQVQAWRV